MKYSKPRLLYDAQVRLLQHRGLDVGLERDAVQALKRIGYYRLSAYTYPMREQLANAGVGSQRSECFSTGSKLSDAVALHDFDHRLRRTLLPGIQTIEVSLRTKVAYNLGRHGALAHLDRTGLDATECDTPGQGPTKNGTKYENWLSEYRSLQAKAHREDYMRHFRQKYDGDVPIWAATEFMTMGCLIALFRLMDHGDRRRIAHEYSVKDPQVLFGWLKSLNVLRNQCAHNNRIWNRSNTYPPAKIHPRMVESELHHLRGSNNTKIYFLMAVSAYLIRQIDPHSSFPADVRTTMKKFPSGLPWTPETSMGFTPQWAKEPLWNV